MAITAKLNLGVLCFSVRISQSTTNRAHTNKTNLINTIFIDRH